MCAWKNANHHDLKPGKSTQPLRSALFTAMLLLPTAISMVNILLSLVVIPATGENFNLAVYSPSPCNDVLYSNSNEEAVRMAVETVNNDTTLCPGLNVSYSMYYTGCSSAEGLATFVATAGGGELHPPADAFIGPVSTEVCTPSAQLATAWNKAILSWGCLKSALNQLPTFTRLVPSSSRVAKAVAETMKFYSWVHAALVISMKPMWKELGDYIYKALKEAGLKVDVQLSVSKETTGTEMAEKLGNISDIPDIKGKK